MPISKVYMICNAYESGFGHGIKQDEQTGDYYADPECNEAYHLGYAQGEATITKDACDMRDHMLLNKHGVKKCLVCGKNLNNL